MKTRFIILVVCVVGVVAIVAWRESRFVGQAKQTRTTLSASTAKDAAALCEAEARLAVAEKERADLQATLDSLAKMAPVKAVAPPKKANLDAASQLAEFIKTEGEREKDPRVQLRQLAAARARLAARYGALYWRLKLTPDQIDRFEIIAARKAEQDDDLRIAVQAQGVGVSDADFGKLYTPLHMKNEDAYRAATKELLGEAGYQQFNDYERQLSARTHIQAVAGAAVLEGTSFSPQQAEQLVGILASTSSSYRKGGQVDSANIDWDQVDERAREILSSEQMTVFQTLEPSTGNTGRFRLQFSRALNEALQADRKQATAAKPTGDE